MVALLKNVYKHKAFYMQPVWFIKTHVGIEVATMFFSNPWKMKTISCRRKKTVQGLDGFSIAGMRFPIRVPG
jgi:hypothetical protein